MIKSGLFLVLLFSSLAANADCHITVFGSCTRGPAYSNKQFKDNWEGSSTSVLRCLKRAREYYNWCGGKATIRNVVASHHDRGVYKLGVVVDDKGSYFLSEDSATLINYGSFQG